MKIATNINSLRNSGPYLNSIGVEFLYANTNVYTLIDQGANIILADISAETELATVDYPDVQFVGKGHSFPNYNMEFPDALLNEMSLMYNQDIVFPKCDISYFNTLGRENEMFIYKLRALGNTKIIGPYVSVDTVYTHKNTNISHLFYRHSRVVAADNKEEILKCLFLNKPCITMINHPYTYNIDRIRSDVNKLGPNQGQVDFAWQVSHTNILCRVLELTDNKNLASQLQNKFKFEEKHETRN